MSPVPFCVRPTMIPVEPAFERIEQGSARCPVGSSEPAPAVESVVLFRWPRFPRLRRQKGLATGIIGLW
jgi:hypothetical protein